MQLILNIPMLTNHRDEVTGRSDEARNVDPVVTGNGRTWVSGTNRFDDNHRLEVRPFRQRRKNGKSVMVQTLRRTVRPCESSKASKKLSALRHGRLCSIS